MTRNQEPEADLVKKAARALSDFKSASLKTIQRMAAVVLGDQGFYLQPHNIKPT